MSATPQYPVVDIRSLPIGHTGSDLTVVGVRGNRNAVRVSWSELSSTFVVKATGEPAASTSGSKSGDLFIGPTGIFSYRGADAIAWGKTPRYLHNWGDLTADTRFLLVNATMALTGTELAHVRETLHLHTATRQEAGLVKPGAPSVYSGEGTTSANWYAGVNVAADGSMTVPYATPNTPGPVLLDGDSPHSAVSRDVVRGMVAGMMSVYSSCPIASATTVGGFKLPAQNSQVSIAENGDISIATAQTPTKPWTDPTWDNDVRGVVALAYPTLPDADFYKKMEWDPEARQYVEIVQSTVVDPDRDFIPTVQRVRSEIGNATAEFYNYMATTDRPGLMQPKPNGALVLDYNELVSTGRVDVRPATFNKYGAVYATDTFYEAAAAVGTGYPVVPTTDAVVEYFSASIAAILGTAIRDALYSSDWHDVLPIADGATHYGIVAEGVGISITEGRVSAKEATLNGLSAGTVRVQAATDESGSSVPVVPTVSRVEEQIQEAIDSSQITTSNLVVNTLQVNTNATLPYKPLQQIGDDDAVSRRTVQDMLDAVVPPEVPEKTYSSLEVNDWHPTLAHDRFSNVGSLDVWYTVRYSQGTPEYNNLSMGILMRDLRAHCEHNTLDVVVYNSRDYDPSEAPPTLTVSYSSIGHEMELNTDQYIRYVTIPHGEAAMFRVTNIMNAFTDPNAPSMPITRVVPVMQYDVTLS